MNSESVEPAIKISLFLLIVGLSSKSTKLYVNDKDSLIFAALNVVERLSLILSGMIFIAGFINFLGTEQTTDLIVFLQSFFSLGIPFFFGTLAGMKSKSINDQAARVCLMLYATCFLVVVSRLYLTPHLGNLN